MTSIVEYLQATAPALATQLTEERIASMKRIAELETKLAVLEAAISRDFVSHEGGDVSEVTTLTVSTCKDCDALVVGKLDT